MSRIFNTISCHVYVQILEQNCHKLKLRGVNFVLTYLNERKKNCFYLYSNLSIRMQKYVIASVNYITFMLAKNNIFYHIKN